MREHSLRGLAVSLGGPRTGGRSGVWRRSTCSRGWETRHGNSSLETPVCPDPTAATASWPASWTPPPTGTSSCRGSRPTCCSTLRHRCQDACGSRSSGRTRSINCTRELHRRMERFSQESGTERRTGSSSWYLIIPIISARHDAHAFDSLNRFKSGHSCSIPTWPNSSPSWSPPSSRVSAPMAAVPRPTRRPRQLPPPISP